MRVRCRILWVSKRRRKESGERRSRLTLWKYSTRALKEIRIRQVSFNYMTNRQSRLISISNKGTDITALAQALGYEREVIRIWFCNKRQALKNTVRMMSKGMPN